MFQGWLIERGERIVDRSRPCDAYSSKMRSAGQLVVESTRASMVDSYMSTSGARRVRSCIGRVVLNRHEEADLVSELIAAKCFYMSTTRRVVFLVESCAA